MMTSSKITTFIATLFLFAFLFAASADLRYGPYLQSLSSDTVKICLAVEAGDSVTVRLLTPDGEALTKPAEGTSPACVQWTGLLPDLVYGYEILVNGENVTENMQASFVADSEAEQTLVIFGDTRSGEESFDLKHRQIVQAIRENVVPDAIIHTGDFVERGDDEALWSNFFRIEGDLLAGSPLYPSIGRSDQPPEKMRSLFPLLKKNPWYSFDRGEVHVSVLKLWRGSSQSDDETTANGAQANWLRKDLGEARERGARHLFVVMHEPAIDIRGKSPRAVREVFIPIFQSYGVNAVFSGAHYFSHAFREGVHYFTNGGGGAVLETAPPPEGVFRFFQSIHHFLVLETNRTGANVRAVNARGESFYSVALDGAALKNEGSTFVKNYPGGPKTATLAVFFQEGCEDCDLLKEELPDLAKQTGTMLLTTFHSLESSQNKALLKARAGISGPLPIVLVGEEVLAGMEEIHTGFGDAVADIAILADRTESDAWRFAVAAILLFAGIILVAYVIRKRQQQTTTT